MQSVFVMLFVGAIAFTLFQFVGDPINQMVGEDATQAEREELRERLGLNDPLIVQFGRFAGNMATGDFGFSYQHKRPVIDLIAERLPATL
ncbi:MAG: ABC transporter permease, partial [Oceanibaculum nanhaiense]|nr:ABC transporter permease [Oceanibaculum nanhaiense]